MLNVNKPSTIWVHFTGEQLPKYFCLYNDKEQTYYFRFIDGRTPRIKFNVPDIGNYSGNVPFKVVKIEPIEVPEMPALPPAERNRWKPVFMVFNPDLQGTPCRIFTETGVIEHAPVYYTYPPAMRLFLDLHEMGHLLYTTEAYCDLYALINFLRMGYNRSTAYYTLSKILTRSNENIDRLKFMLSQVNGLGGDAFAAY